MEKNATETTLEIGPSAIEAYSRLSYTMWYALAEFIDNSTQSRMNYESIIDDVLLNEGTPLTVKIDHNRIKREISISDNSIGMTNADLVNALRIACPTPDSKGRSKYGMGMKTAACWIGKRWRIETCEWASGQEWTAEVDVAAVARSQAKIPLSLREVSTNEHYTRIIISEMQRYIQGRTEETIKNYLGSMYRFDLKEGKLKLIYNNEEIQPPDEYEYDTDPEGKPMMREIPETMINGKSIRGWFAVLKKGGRKFGGFSLFQNRRQIQGFPNAWKPQSIFGGVEDEGANNLVAQRLTGLLELDGFQVSHTKDTILFQDDEEEQLVKLLDEQTKDYRNYAQKRRGSRGQPWTPEKLNDLFQGLKREFESPEMKDAVSSSLLPPLQTIQANNQSQLAALVPSDTMATVDLTPQLKVVISLSNKSEFEPHLTIVAGAEPRTIHVIINGLHPYYNELESTEAINECIKQYLYDAIAEYRVSQLTARVNTDSIRRLKNDLLRVQVVKIENAASAIRAGELETTIFSDNDNG
ncbi:ATP-binding protein [Gloeobacter kilaueensis]|uniref:Heat shock protein 90 n=1 Tax=Gloeobacter kilaueensis (strain ATCC BAA-2537 / CCAP 1431/1 / ULC 316 / JS1) TaxID=1183438 RepID=U5QP98_GLOK1|nr:ATP-binding protein [Gloeobacter kilaueensis]AGY60723.1 heat shock protein 90 [Gloeobacter kilaueensis JS1]